MKNQKNKLSRLCPANQQTGLNQHRDKRQAYQPSQCFLLLASCYFYYSFNYFPLGCEGSLFLSFTCSGKSLLFNRNFSVSLRGARRGRGGRPTKQGLGRPRIPPSCRQQPRRHATGRREREESIPERSSRELRRH